jgi:hypothetical protein
MTPKAFKLFVLGFILFLVLLIVCGFYLGKAVIKLIAVVKEDITSEIKLRVSQEERIRKATDQAVENILYQTKAYYVASGYVKRVNPELSTDTIKDVITVTYKLCQEYRVDFWGVLAVLKVESDFNPHLPTGKAGERGSLQVTPGKFEEYLNRLGYCKNDFNNWHCTQTVGVVFLKDLLIYTRSNWEDAVGRFNAGDSGGWRERSKAHVEKFRKAYREILELKELVGVDYQL